MDRRKALKLAAGVVAGGGAGIITLSSAFKTEAQPLSPGANPEYKNTDSIWRYSLLDPELTAELAYKDYDHGSCMYATFKSVVSQLAEKYGEPYTSFPFHMMKYGHGGVGGFGTICGALNGASALIGLLVTDKTIRDNLITDILRWYENTKLPEYMPKTAIYDFLPPPTITNSVLCHVSNTNWAKKTGYKVNSLERKERCRRLTSDVAYQVTSLMNEYHTNIFIANKNDNETVRECMSCHGEQGKLVNTSGKMGCSSCHTESVGHRIFADIHYKIMKEK
ncbi:MAG: C-GCAxxG-C-C family protein [Bacteroidales bacterium]|nr:C-GCAxxG-C-C family protein [Bacteroidales bacterium]